jgi:hypothetical protein
MIQENEIRAQLVEYLSGNRGLDEFEDWFVQRSWNMHRDSSPDAQRLASQVELALSEFNNDDITEAALRERMRSLASTHIVSFSPVQESGSVTYTSNSSVQIPLVGLQVSAVSVS